MTRRGDPGDGDGLEPLDDGDLDAKVCPTCGRDLPPWYSDCPACREPAVLRFGFAGAALPAVPDHLRDAIDEPAADEAGRDRSTESATDADVAAAEVGAHKPDDDPLHDPAPAEAAVMPFGALPWLGAGAGGAGGGGCGGAGGGC